MINKSLGLGVAACLVAGCSPQAITVEQCLEMAADRNERSQIKYELRYSDYEAYRGVDLYRLYRTETGGEGEVPLATFDSTAGKRFTPDFNKAACELAATGMAGEDAYGRDYWCEPVIGLT